MNSLNKKDYVNVSEQLPISIKSHFLSLKFEHKTKNLNISTTRSNKEKQINSIASEAKKAEKLKRDLHAKTNIDSSKLNKKSKEFTAASNNMKSSDLCPQIKSNKSQNTKQISPLNELIFNINTNKVNDTTQTKNISDRYAHILNPNSNNKKQTNSSRKKSNSKNSLKIIQENPIKSIFQTGVNIKINKEKITEIFRKGIPQEQKRLLTLTNSRVNSAYPTLATEYSTNKSSILNAITDISEIKKEFSTTYQWHQGNLNKQIKMKFNSDFRLIHRQKFSEKFRVNKNFPDTDFTITDKIKSSLAEELDVENLKLKISQNTKKKNEIKKRWKWIIMIAAEHFKKLKLSLEEFYENQHLTFSPYQHEGSKEFIGAIKEGDSYYLKKLLKENKLLVHSFDYFGQTPLHWASKRDKFELIPLLLRFGARIDVRDHSGRTPLHCAAEYNGLESVKILLMEMANPLASDNNCKLPVEYTKDRRIIFYLNRAKNLHIVNRIDNARVMWERIRKGFKFFFDYEDNPLLKEYFVQNKKLENKKLK